MLICCVSFGKSHSLSEPWISSVYQLSVESRVLHGVRGCKCFLSVLGTLERTQEPRGPGGLARLGEMGEGRSLQWAEPASAQGGAQFGLAPLPLPPLSLLALCWSWSRIPFFWQMISMCLGLGFPSSGPSPLGTEAPHGLTPRGAGRTRLASGLTIRAGLVSVLMTRGALRRGSEPGMNSHRRWEGGNRAQQTD